MTTLPPDQDEGDPLERLHVDDAHSESQDAEGEAETIQTHPNRVLAYRGRLHLTRDVNFLHYSRTRELLRDRAAIRTRTWIEDIFRDLKQ